MLFAALSGIARRGTCDKMKTAVDQQVAGFELAADVLPVVAVRSAGAMAPMPVLIDATCGLPGLLAINPGQRARDAGLRALDQPFAGAITT